MRTDLGVLRERGAASFPSGVTLAVVSGPDGPGAEHWDPHRTGNPLYDTGPPVTAVRLSTHFTVGELVRSGGRPSDRARIDPALVRCLQAIRDRAGAPVRISSGYRSWARNVALYRRRGRRPTLSRHCSGQAADISVDGLSGLQIAKLAVDACGPNIAIGVGDRFAHIDVRGSWAAWTYFAGARNDAVRAELATYRRGRAEPV